MAALEALGWPTRQGGLYFRYTVIAELGLVLLAALALARHRAAQWLALGVLVLHVAEGVHASGPWTTRARTTVAARAVMERLEGSDGAVLELPLQGPTDGWFGQAGLLRAVFHGRPTTSLPRGVKDRLHPTRVLVDRAFRSTRPETVRVLLREAGYRLIVLPDDLVPHTDPPMSRLQRMLGEPLHADGAYVWDLGSARPACRPPRSGGPPQ